MNTEKEKVSEIWGCKRIIDSIRAGLVGYGGRLTPSFLPLNIPRMQLRVILAALAIGRQLTPQITTPGKPGLDLFSPLD